jgi:predicted nucleic-acid-binding protein
MNSILTERVAIDTNVLIYAVSEGSTFPQCRTIIFDWLAELDIFIPQQVISELHRNLSQRQLRTAYSVLMLPRSIAFDGASPDEESIERFRELGAKKGDAIISAQLEVAGVKWLISENRHFLAEIQDLPFKVISAERALRMIQAALSDIDDHSSIA